MQQRARIPCWSCQLVYPGRVDCDVCGGARQLERAAQMADLESSHALFERVLRGLEEVVEDPRAALIEALIAWQLYGAAYVQIEHGLDAASPAFADAHARLRDRLVGAIRALG